MEVAISSDCWEIQQPILFDLNFSAGKGKRYWMGIHHILRSDKKVVFLTCDHYYFIIISLCICE